ncbi:MAG: alpha/beta hydrolase family protein [Sphingomonas sp.]|uniref:alpha/beta hydrolase family protein n=1 Tax=Sphingomonas sp. TaxID=28214 RepID=UPI003F7DDF18
MLRRIVLAAAAAALLPAFTAAIAQEAKPATSAPATAPSGPPPAAAFAQLPFIESPVLSPDGTRVAARIAIQGKMRLAIIPLADTSKIKLIDPGDFDLNDWMWVNNDWLLLRAGEMQPVQGDSWYVRRAFGVRADGGKINVLALPETAQGGDDVLWVAHDGSPRALIAMQTSIYVNEPGFWPQVRDFDISTGKSKLVQSSMTDVMNWSADTAGTIRLGIAYDDDRRSSRALYRSQPGASLRTIDRAKGPNASLNTLPALILPQSGQAIAIDDDDGYDAVYNYDLDTMKIGAKIFDVPGYDIDGAIPDPTGTRLLGFRYTDTRPRTKWLDPKLVEIQGDLDKAVPNLWPQIVSWSDDFSVLIVHIGAADSPGSFYLYRPAEGHMPLFAKINDALGTRSYAPVKTVRFAARDGTEMSAVLTLPQGRETKNLPLILMPHGGPAVRDDEEWDWWVQFMASRGYAVLQPNYRGSTGFGTKFTKLGEGQWGLKMQDDLVDAVAWAAKQGIADPKRVCIVGGSYGGYAAFRAAQRDKGVYRCAVSFAGVSDMSAMLRYDGSFLNGGRNKDYLRAQAPDLKAVSPINFATDFSTPILIMHGKADQVVPVKQSREMVEKLKAAGATYRYVEQPLGDHHFTRQADRLQFLQELEAFLAKYNPA